MLTRRHPLARAARDPRMIARFWRSVDRSDADGACWPWIGRRAGGRPVFSVKYSSIAAARVAWFVMTGQFPIGGKLRHSCENADCVRPEHLEWELGMRRGRMWRERSDGYVSQVGIWTIGHEPDSVRRRRRAS